MPEPEVLPAKHDVGAHAHAAESHAAGHGYDFMSSLMHHVRPSPAVQYGHGKPVLILDLGTFAGRNLETLSASPSFKDADGQPYLRWADEVAAKPEFKGADQHHLAKAMAVAKDWNYVGAFPKPLSWMNQQTFFGTFALVLLAFILLVVARRRADQVQPRGRLQNLIEASVVFVRDEIVRPNIHHGDSWAPYFCGLFLCIFAFNLIGLVPIFSAASGNPGVTVAFAITTFIAMLVYGIREQGPVSFWINLVPVKWAWNPMDMVIWLMLAPVELLGLVIKPAALAIRLFANMFAGHSVLVAFSSLGFILYYSAAGGQANPDNAALALGMGGFGFLLTVALYFLELLIAFLQAYVFTMLSAVFIGSAIHPEH